MPIRDIGQFWAGLLFLILGCGALRMVPRPLGTLATMGPGYFPMLLGIGLVLLGAGGMMSGIWASFEHRAARLPVAPTIFILGGVLAFGALINDAGLAISLLLLAPSSCYARLLKHPLEVLVIYLIPAARCLDSKKLLEGLDWS